MIVIKYLFYDILADYPSRLWCTQPGAFLPWKVGILISVDIMVI